MTPIEKRIASFIQDHWEEKEDSCGDLYLRVYADKTFNGAVKDCKFYDHKVTDVLCIEYAQYERYGKRYEHVQLFVSDTEDDAQDWFTLSDLSRRDRINVVVLFEQMVAGGGFTIKTPAIVM